MSHRAYISDSFLLGNSLAQTLYDSYAAELPIIDFHTHLEAKDIYENRHYTSLTDAWLSDDHYLWRAMRSVGIDEHYITGTASEYEKFSKLCESMPYLIGSPLYQWCHLELKRFFNLDLLLCPENCQNIWQHCNQMFKHGKLSVQSILTKHKVQVICTTDDPSSDLSYHAKLQNTAFSVKVLPTFRADSLITITNQDAFKKILQPLENASKIAIADWASFQKAVEQRVDFFHSLGCRLSDVGIHYLTPIDSQNKNIETLFLQLLQGNALSFEQLKYIEAEIFHFLAMLYQKNNWTMQLHLGVMPNINQRRLKSIGKGTGFTTMHDQPMIQPLAAYLDRLDQIEQLPQTILYNLNPKDTWAIASLIGAFQDDSRTGGKIQLGAAWWFNDHKHGMIEQMTALANLGAFGKFVGMVTDSRSFFSVSRHEYFRRVLCNLLATWVENGDIPNDIHLLKQTIANIGYDNARHYLNF